MFDIVANRVFPFIKEMRGEDSTHTHFMKDARLTIPNAGMLQRVADRLDKVPMENRDTKGDVYEYLLAKIAAAGQNGQFRTPRHIIELMVHMRAPKPGDTIVDPASGTCGFLVCASEYMRPNHADANNSGAGKHHYHHEMFHGFDFDNTMLRPRRESRRSSSRTTTSRGRSSPPNPAPPAVLPSATTSGGSKVQVCRATLYHSR